MARCVAVAILLAGCTPPYGDELARVEGVQEALVRWAAENAWTNLDPPAAYCVAIHAVDETPGDPSKDLVARLSDMSVPVRPWSECDQLPPDADPHERMRHSIIVRATGAYALVFAIYPITWHDDTHAEVSLLTLQGGEAGKVWGCQVAWTESDGWYVADCPMTTDI